MALDWPFLWPGPSTVRLGRCAGSSERTCGSFSGPLRGGGCPRKGSSGDSFPLRPPSGRPSICCASFASCADRRARPWRCAHCDGPEASWAWRTSSPATDGLAFCRRCLGERARPGCGWRVVIRPGAGGALLAAPCALDNDTDPIGFSPPGFAGVRRLSVNVDSHSFGRAR